MDPHGNRSRLTVVAGAEAGGVGPADARARYATPTGDPCPRCLRVDGTVLGTGECLSCGFCLLLSEAAWGGPPA